MLMRLLTLIILMTGVFNPSAAPPLHGGTSLSYILSEINSEVQEWSPNTQSGLWEFGNHHEGDIMRPYPSSAGSHSRKKRTIMRYDVSYWKDAVVPVDIKYEEFDEEEVQIVLKAMKEIEDNTCIRFPSRRKKNKSYIEVKGDLGEGECWSFLGRQGGNQTLSLGEGCVIYHYVLHELLHALGMVHQHSAPDRDKYIKIHWENIDRSSKFAGWFDKYDWTEYTDFDLGYDYYSVMHYSAYVGSKNGKPTISSRDKHVKIEERTKLSEIDILKLNMLYCTEHIGVRPDGSPYYLFYEKNQKLKY